ncbi:unnamed protein product [Timema podura]|uniref:Pre-mRNA-splicing factor 18 n=1 Tax=Timema podura TaxID=61482 RepID=A0ABN7NRQ2_TIMPD|nr:unnamed protein product [Timema podura]
MWLTQMGGRMLWLQEYFIYSIRILFMLKKWTSHTPIGHGERKGLRNDFQEALEKVDQAFLDEILATQAQNGEGRSTNDVKVPDDGITYEEIQKMAAELGKGEKELDMRVITHFIQFLLLMWGNRLNSRTAAEKTAVRGKLACATYTQTQVYLKPLLRKLKTKSLPEDILDSLTEITRFMMDRDYIKVIITIVLNLADLFISFEPFCNQIISIKSRVGTHKSNPPTPKKPYTAYKRATAHS